jgi:YVTN family beta-propeller protein
MKKIIGLFIFSVVFTACEKNDPVQELKPVTPSGVFILNQGGYGQNNAGITHYSLKTGDIIADIMDGALGDTGQDMILYGGKLYVSVYGTSVINVIDLKTTASLKIIPVKDSNGTVARGPRSLAAYAGKIYASTHDGHVIRIDTTTLAIEAITETGPYPEGIAAAGGKLYVANSNGLNFPDFDNTLSIIDIAEFKETERITVGLNPNGVAADARGDIYLSHKGNYVDIPSGMKKIDARTGELTDLAGVASGENFTIADDMLYYFNVAYTSEGTVCTFGRYNISTGQKAPEEIITDGTKINTAFAIGVDPDSRDVYISDTNPHKVYIFDADGRLKKTIDAGVFACKFIFY